MAAADGDAAATTTVLRCAVLGPLEVTDADGVDRTPGGALQRRLLGVLVLHRGRTVSVDALAGVLWPDRLPGDHIAAVHTHVFRLRRRLPDLTVDQQAPGYRLRTDGLTVDADEFESAISAAAAVRVDDPTRALALLESAVAMWRGHPYDDLGAVDDALIETRRLDEVRLRAMEERFAALLDLDRAGEAVADLEALVAHEPLRERPRELLMRALAVTGRRADALRCYDEYRRSLATELGIEPSMQMVALNESLLFDDLPGAAERARAVRTGSDVGFIDRCRPPLPVRALVGRDREFADVEQALASARVVTLIGTGGVGKTSLAVDAVHRLGPTRADGVAFVELAGSSPGSVPVDLLSAFGVEPRVGVPAGRRIGDVLADRAVLLVLDNCEHVLDDVAPIVEDLTSRCPNVTVLATSRERLAVAGERLVGVPPLVWTGGGDAIAPALELFRERAREVDPSFELDELTTPVVARICRQLGGLPLALELAATRLHVLGLDEISAGLEYNQALLSGGRRAVARHRSIATALAWSFDMLDQRERQSMHSLAVFASPFRVADAARVLDAPGHEVAELVAALVDRSLVQRTDDHFALLEPVRQFATADGVDDAHHRDVRRRHARHMVEMAEVAAQQLRTASAAAGFERIRTLLPDLRGAFGSVLDDGDLDLGVRLCAAVRDAALMAMLPEPLAWARQLARLAQRADHPGGPALFGVAALGAWKSGDIESTGQLLEEAEREIVRLHLDDHYFVRDMQGTLAAVSGRVDEAIEQYRVALTLPAALHDPVWRSESGATLASALSYRRDPAAADEAERLVGDLLPPRCPVGEAWCWYGAGEAVLTIDPVAARERLARAVDVAREGGVTFVEAVAGASLASLAVRHGDPARAVEAYRWLLPLMQRGGAVSPLWTALRTVAELFVRHGADEPAAVLLGAVTSPTTGHRVFGHDELLLARLHEALVDRLGVDTLDRAMARGRELDDSAAADLAMAVLGRLEGGGGSQPEA